ncbi:MAG TPA: NADH-quinone oxidoreductase subunit C [Steroidobacteraceae bacterium]|jgi:NADH-quinone oxidoreductase subunit C|nr:NADH-quinone oxidoreductase subunit C [Steroidobacteraceae bacterium]
MSATPTGAAEGRAPSRLDRLETAIAAAIATGLTRIPTHTGEASYEVAADALLDTARTLRDAPELKFEMCMDVCGVDFLDHGRAEWKTEGATASGFSRGVARGPKEDEPPPTVAKGRRFAVVYNLLSVSLNQRVRLKVFCPDDAEPMVDSVTGIWAGVDWFEREAFDLYGILFRGHPDLRRLLTDYGFIGYPFRKDFPLSGNVEVRYDPEKGRVVYQPVSIEPRTLVPKVIRHDNRYDPALTRAPVEPDTKPNG